MTDITYVKLASNGNSTSTHSKLVISSTIVLPFYRYGRFHQSLKNPHCHHQDQLETGFHGNRSGLSSWSVDAEQNSPSSNPSLTLLSSCHHLIEYFTAFPVSKARQSYLREPVQYYFFHWVRKVIPPPPPTSLCRPKGLKRDKNGLQMGQKGIRMDWKGLKNYQTG